MNLAFADEPGLEVAVAVAGDLDLELAVAVDHSLEALAVAGVAIPATVDRVPLAGQVLGPLALTDSLSQVALQFRWSRPN